MYIYHPSQGRVVLFTSMTKLNNNGISPLYAIYCLCCYEVPTYRLIVPC